MLACLDVGFSNMGVSIFHDGRPVHMGVVRPSKCNRKNVRVADDTAFRSAQIARELSDLFDSYKVQGVVGELPSGGALSADAMKQMAMATTLVATLCELKGLPTEWCTPGDVKKAVAGSKSASKTEIMEIVCDKLGGTMTRKGKVTSYAINGWDFCGGTFEHIADSVGAMWALQCGNLVKMFG